MKRFHLLTIFPDIFDSYLKESFLKRAQEKKLIAIATHNIRDFATDKHKKTDDRPFGGGPGMVMKIEPIYRATEAIKRRSKTRPAKRRVILFSPRGTLFTGTVAKRLAKYDELVLICGRYEGVDERVADQIADETISIGDFVLSGGELPALVLMEATCRFIPGFLGKYESLEDLKGSYPAYTRPEAFAAKNGKQWKVPTVLLSGDHKKIEEWRRKH